MRSGSQAEYLADIQIFVKCDRFVGSESSVYPIVEALRSLRVHVQTIPSPCLFSVRDKPIRLERDVETLRETVWLKYFGGYDSNGVNFWY
jgi:hypothetical protein